VLKLDALHCRTGYHGICFIVRGNRGAHASPVVAKTGDIGRYFEDLVNKPLLHMLDDLDVWCANGLTGLAQAKKRSQDCKKFCRNQLKLELRQ